MVRNLFILLFLLLYPSLSFGQPVINWEVVNPFPFFTNTKFIDEIREVYASLPLERQTAEGLERALQDAADKEITKIREEANRKYNCSKIKKKEREKKKECFATYLGWFARLVEDRLTDSLKPENIADRYKETCWDYENKKYRTTGRCADYVRDKKFVAVRAWIDEGNGVVRWFKHGISFSPQRCGDKYVRKNCVQFEVPYTGNDNLAEVTQISAEMDGIAVPAVPIAVNDRLIVGLGDSFAAGEGNPDRPASFTSDRTDIDFFTTKGLIRRHAKRDREAEAVWLDRRCHRSMYSYQFKTALQYAVMNPQEVVTFISFSCSGGTTGEIIDVHQKPQEGEGPLKPQLGALRQALEDSKREIDYLLLSTGGNDTDFKDHVASVVLSGVFRSLYRKFKKVRKLDASNNALIREELIESSDPKKRNYFRLQDAILDKKTGVAIKGCGKKENGEASPCERIILTSYPNLVFSKNGRCKADQEEFEVPFGESKVRPLRIEEAEKFLIEPLQATQRDVLVTGKLGWTVVTSHHERFLEHGFCAREKVIVDINDPSTSAEVFVMPNRKNMRWHSIRPWNYKVYASRQRWIKLPIDAKLATDQRSYWNFPFFDVSVDFLFIDDASSIMHPTAEGLAHTADANIKAIEKIRKK